METKIVKKFFGLADFLEEQQFLEEQHKNGWKLLSFHGLNKYTFEECFAEEYVYRLDYNVEYKDEDEYLQMFEDCGWEYIMKYQTWYYFRKKKSYMNVADNEIFSDNDSKLDMIKKVMWKQLFLMLPIMFFFIIYNFIVIKGYFEQKIILQILWIIYALVMAFLLGMNINNVIKLNKLMAELENPIDKK